MIKIPRFAKRLLSALLALLLIAAAMPAMAASSFEAVVTSDSMPVYAQTAPHDYLGALPRGTRVTVLDYVNGVALILYRGYEGVARVSDMQRVADEPETTVETPTAAKPVIALRDTRVYRQASVSSRYVTVQAGTQMNLLAVNGNCAKVERGGAVGYMVYSHLGDPGSDLETTEETTPTETTETTVEWREYNLPVVTTQATRVYQQPSASSRSIAVGKGMKLTLLALSGSCAKVGRGSAVGYMDASHLARDEAGSEESTESQPTRTGSNPFAAGSNESVIYSFLTGEGGYNRAAAMGIMANIKYESGYRPTVVGDGGTSYGICQWHLGRKTNLINWCTENNYDYNTLEGQLRFLKYELTTRYTSVHNYLKRVEDSDEGAYDAAYYFCFNFEAPAARTSQSTARGRFARDTLYRL